MDDMILGVLIAIGVVTTTLGVGVFTFCLAVPSRRSEIYVSERHPAPGKPLKQIGLESKLKAVRTTK